MIFKFFPGIKVALKKINVGDRSKPVDIVLPCTDEVKPLQKGPMVCGYGAKRRGTVGNSMEYATSFTIGSIRAISPFSRATKPSQL